MTRPATSPEAITLAIETSNPGALPEGAHGEVALGAAQRGPDGRAGAPRILDSEPVRPTAERDDGLAPAIDRLCARAGVLPAAISRVAVSVGPGGFTSVRVADATAKCIAEATGAACVALPSAEIALRAVLAERPVLFPAGVAMASKRGSAWFACFDAPEVDGATGLPRWTGEPSGVILDAAGLADAQRQRPVRSLLADAHLPAELAAWAAHAGVGLVPASCTARACFEASLFRPPTDPLALSPLYPREPEAVTKWRERKKEARSR